jgi:hypothetical protein
MYGTSVRCIYSVRSAHFNGHLANRFEERQRFDIAYGTADFHQHDIMAFTAFNDALFDSIGDVRNNLNGRPGSRHGALCAALRNRYGQS